MKKRIPDRPHGSQLFNVANLVEFIVVGGAGAVLHGAPITTEDLDIVHRRSPENVARLRTLLDELGAHVRELANRRLPPQESALPGERQVLLSTRLGPLDCLGTLTDGGGGFEDLVSHSEEHSRNKRPFSFAPHAT